MRTDFRRFLSDPGTSFFLLGPRGTGKSTWIRSTFPSALLVDLVQPDTFREFAARPERLRDLIAAHPTRDVVVVDEVQKVPALLDVVHALIESKGPHRFVLSGSSSRKLKRSGVDLLAGRALQRTMHPLMAAEMSSEFRLEDALTLGLLPVVVRSKRPRDTLSAYVGLYVREEVQAEGLVRNVGDFSRFLETISFSHGATVNLSNLARECQVGRKSVESYLSILEDLLLAFRVPVFHRRAQRATTQHPKFYFADTGVFRSLRPSGPLDSRGEIEGAALEGLVAQHLRAWCSYGDRRCDLYFWRTAAGSEVDFILYGEDTFWAIEVKNSNRIRPEDLRSLKTFTSDYPEARGVLLHRGPDRIDLNGILCIPCADFLAALTPGESLLDLRH